MDAAAGRLEVKGLKLTWRLCDQVSWSHKSPVRRNGRNYLVNGHTKIRERKKEISSQTRPRIYAIAFRVLSSV